MSLILIFVKDLNGMRYVGVLNVIIYSFVLILLMVQSPAVRSKYIADDQYSIAYLWKSPKMDWASGLATMLLAFLSHPTFFNVREELADPSPQRVKKIVRTSVILETLIFITCAIFGYFSLGDNHMVDMFVLREKYSETDYLMQGAISMFIMLTFYGILLLFFSCREQFCQELNLDSKAFGNRVKVTSILLFIIFAIAIGFPDMTQAFGVIGGLFCTLMGWIVPFSIKLKMLSNQGKSWNSFPKFFYYVALFFVIFISISATVQSVLSL